MYWDGWLSSHSFPLSWLYQCSYLPGIYSFDLFEDQNLVNLSRMDPNELATRWLSTNSKTLGLTLSLINLADTRYVICVFIIHIIECNLVSPRRTYSLTGPGLKVIEGDFLVQEFKHLLRCLGVVYGTTSFTCDLSNSHVQFRTFVPSEKIRNEGSIYRQGNTLLLYVTMHNWSFLVGFCPNSSGTSGLSMPVKDKSKFVFSISSPRSMAGASNAHLTVNSHKQGWLSFIWCVYAVLPFQCWFTTTLPRSNLTRMWISTLHCMMHCTTTTTFRLGCWHLLHTRSTRLKGRMVQRTTLGLISIGQCYWARYKWTPHFINTKEG